MTKSKQRKLKMAMMIGFAVLSTTSLAVSSFAWFIVKNKATFNVNQLTVEAPDDFAFYAYKGNRDASHTLQSTFADDFTLINSSNLSTETNLTDLKPGDVKTYCIVISSHDTSKNVTLNITKITSNDANMQSGKHRYVHGGTVEINIGWAINIYSTAATSNASTGYSSFVTSTTGTDKFTYTNNNRSTYLAGTTDGNAINLSTPIPVFDTTVASATVYLYYSVVFDNSNEVLYREVDSTGDSVLIPGSASTRYFKVYNNSDSALEKSRCNSNCYQGLTFALNSLSLEF